MSDNNRADAASGLGNAAPLNQPEPHSHQPAPLSLLPRRRCTSNGTIF
jgi:hypothetical protein